VKTTEAKPRMEGALVEPRRKVRKLKRPKTYHHGSLREAMLQAAERILEHRGIQGLTLRAAAREAGVSHAAPKTHFGDMTGLLSELAAVGFERFVATMQANARESDPPDQRMAAIGRGYVTFARTHPDLFLLMFRPALRDAVAASSRVLLGAVGAVRDENLAPALTLPQAGSIVRAWRWCTALPCCCLTVALDRCSLACHPTLTRMTC
jgi:AcrR family transcriptional regulator